MKPVLQTQRPFELHVPLPLHVAADWQKRHVGYA